MTEGAADNGGRQERLVPSGTIGLWALLTIVRSRRLGQRIRQAAGGGRATARREAALVHFDLETGVAAGGKPRAEIRREAVGNAPVGLIGSNAPAREGAAQRAGDPDRDGSFSGPRRIVQNADVNVADVPFKDGNEAVHRQMQRRASPSDDGADKRFGAGPVRGVMASEQPRLFKRGETARERAKARPAIRTAVQIDEQTGGAAENERSAEPPGDGDGAGFRADVVGAMGSQHRPSSGKERPVSRGDGVRGVFAGDDDRGSHGRNGRPARSPAASAP